MVELLRTYQPDFMLLLTGICGLILLFSVTIKNLSSKNRTGFIYLNVCATVLVLADRLAYVYRGDESNTGFWLVRVSNFLTYLCVLGVIYFYNLVLKSFIAEVAQDTIKGFRFKIVDCLIGIAVVMLCISQFTGLYYTFDSANNYQRSSLNWISYIFPLAALLFQLSVVIQFRKRFMKKVLIMLILFDTMPIVASVIQVFVYGLSLVNITAALLVIFFYSIALLEMYRQADRSDTLEVEHMRKQQDNMQNILDQTAMALVDALDAKEEYTKGHSVRVANYARQIAELAGLSKKEQREIYYAGLFHDIGKIGVPDEIINKKGKLTQAEYEIMKQHPVIGRRILSGITRMPYLGIGANFHHERFDGTGYPEGLKGENIPEIGRILAVADAYDAMSSMRSYRNAIPQQKIREEFIRHSGTQFDPDYAKLMQHLIDLDSEYQMREMTDTSAQSEKTALECTAFGSEVSEGVLINSNPTIIRLTCYPYQGESMETGLSGMPSLILFDSLDAKVYTEEPYVSDLNYFEYATIRFDGKTVLVGAREYQTDVVEKNSAESDSTGQDMHYEIEAMRYRDHAMFTISNEMHSVKVIVALPDKTRFLYAGITGENCRISEITVQKSENEIGENVIPRIAEEISYIIGPSGDVPNVQIDGYRTDATEPVPIRGNIEISFHTMSLPTARLVWHTSFVDIFSSDNGRVDGPNHKEYALIRLDGEYWDDSDGLAENDMRVTKSDPFTDWDVWKEQNKKGMDVRVRLERTGNQITTITENGGVAIHNTTTIKSDTDDLYVILTGDQVAITNVRISDSSVL